MLFFSLGKVSGAGGSFGEVEFILPGDGGSNFFPKPGEGGSVFLLCPGEGGSIFLLTCGAYVFIFSDFCLAIPLLVGSCWFSYFAGVTLIFVSSTAALNVAFYFDFLSGD